MRIYRYGNARIKKLLKNIKNREFSERDLLLEQTRIRMSDVFTPNQILGRKQTIGCVAVEITQRCNLDCALCYLSEHSESVKDIPIEAIYQRLNEILQHYGVGTHVQITGGDPTLRKHSELIAIVEYAHAIGLYTALFTNGIAASRKLLKQLTDVGLCDVAFHVDTSQGRSGFKTEESLTILRLEYIERARDLGLMVIFNTTIYEGNIKDIPMLVNFFASQTDVVGFSSFQLQAETGRGTWGKRENLVSQENVRKKIELAASKTLPWGLLQVGHRKCHSYMPLLVAGSGIYPVSEDKKLIEDFLHDFKYVRENRHNTIHEICFGYAKILLQKPIWCYRGIKYIATLLWTLRIDLMKSKGRVKKFSIFIHDFMDAKNLEQERIDTCSFMVITTEGPVSMCAHNAKRDEYILKPITFTKQDGSVIKFQPLPN
ncbi:MAG: putative radical SAM superfamily Fe-S cluster-containing enzyme [Gammaproteobacteria bacterium]